MENPYIKQFPELMEGKTVLYVHGFGSSGQSGTVTRLRTVMPNARVLAPDLPVEPNEAIALLHTICQEEKPDLIIGTSMGGMYTEQLRGFDRICINPALEIAETMKAHGMTGTQQFQNPRLDGIQEFYVDKALVKAYKEISEQRFAGVTPEDKRRVYGQCNSLSWGAPHGRQELYAFGSTCHPLDRRQTRETGAPYYIYRCRNNDGQLSKTCIISSEGCAPTHRALPSVLRCSCIGLHHDGIVAHGIFRCSHLSAYHLYPPPRTPLR